MRIDRLELGLAHERIGLGNHMLDADRLVLILLFRPQLNLLFLAVVEVLIPAHPVIM